MVFEDLSKNKRPWKKPFNIQCPVLIGGNLGTSSKFIKSNAWVPWNVEIHLWIFYDSGDGRQSQWTRCLNQHYAVSKPLFVVIPFLIAKPSKQHQLVEPSSFKTYAQINFFHHATLLMVQKSQGQPPVGCIKPATKIRGYLPYQLVSSPRISEPSKEQSIPTWYFCKRQALWSARPTWRSSSRRTQKMTLKNVMPKKEGPNSVWSFIQKKYATFKSDVIFKMFFLNVSRATKAVPFPHDTLLHLQGCEILNFTPRVSPFCFVFFKDWITVFFRHFFSFFL